MSDRRHAAFHWAVILATPFLLLAVDRNLFILTRTNAWIDPWLYTGFLLDLPQFLIRWGDTYYATRLAWLLPGYAIHELFSPILANYVLHIAFFYVVLFAVYALVKSGINRATAFVFTMLVAWDPELLSALGWDYVDGAVITYFVITLLCFEKSSSSNHRRLWAFAAGAGLACLAASNLVATTLWPVCGLFLLLRVGPAHWRRMIPILGLAGVGSVAMFVVFAFLNHQLGGNWFFIKGSLNYASKNLWLPSQFDAKGYAWIEGAPALILPAVAAIGAVVGLVGRWRLVNSFSGAVQVTTFVGVVWFVIHSTLWSHSIHVSYYTSYMIPLALLALAVHPDSPLIIATTVSVRRAIMIELAILALLIAHLLVFRQGDDVWRLVPLAPARFANGFGINTYVADGIATLALVSLRFVAAEWFRWPAFLLALVVGYSSVPTNFPLPTATHAQEDFALTVSVHDFILEHLDPARRLRMWYTITAGEPRPYRNISSTFLWGYVLLNEAMPVLERSTLRNRPNDETRLVVMAATEKEIDAAVQALQKVLYRFEPVARREFGPPDARFHVVIGDLFHIGDADDAVL